MELYNKLLYNNKMAELSSALFKPAPRKGRNPILLNHVCPYFFTGCHVVEDDGIIRISICTMAESLPGHVV